MRLNSYEVLNAFAGQLQRNVTGEGFKTKVIVTPSSIKEAGVVINVSLLKTFIPVDVPAGKASRTLRLRVSVAGRAESMTGLHQALCAIEALDEFFLRDSIRLEAPHPDGTVRGVPNSRIIQYVSEEDSFTDDPDSTSVQYVQDDRIVIITFPQGGD